jgi:hypothetical protein
MKKYTVTYTDMHGTPMNAITEATLAAIAVEAGYNEPSDFAADHDMARCDECGKWGKLGDVMCYRPDQDRDAGVICSSHFSIDADAKRYNDLPDVYSYAPNGCTAYDVDTPEGSVAAHRADMMSMPRGSEY